MELNQLFRRTKIKPVTFPGIAFSESMMACVSSFHDDKSISFTDFDVAILGIDEGLNSSDNQGCGQCPDAIRTYLYSLRKHRENIKILDLGNVLGNTIKDKYFAVSEAIAALSEHGIPVLVLGGSQDFSIPVVEGLAKGEKKVNMCVIDSFVDHLGDHNDLSTLNFVGNMLRPDPPDVARISFLGLQKYLLGKTAQQITEASGVNSINLGELRGEAIREAEPLLRDAHFVSFDSQCMRYCEMPAQRIAMPNGFSASEACQMAWYAGVSDTNQAMGLFEINPIKDPSSVSVSLAAQMGWLYIEGILCRSGDYPKRDIESYSIFLFNKEETGLGLRFFNNPVTGRWWAELDNGETKTVTACSEKEYRMAISNDIPDKWWKIAIKTT